jgi:toxin secretion/phage lysis holin
VMGELSVKVDKLTVLLGAIAAAVTAGVGGWPQAGNVLIWFLVLDFVLGTVRAAIQGRLSSWTSMRKTGMKLVLVWVLVTFAHQLDVALGLASNTTRDVVITFLTVAQGTSVLENSVPIAEAAGWKVPAVLSRALEQLGETREKR